MKTRRIHLQPNEPVELFNSYGTSILKATAMFDHDQAVVVIYEQPGVPIAPATMAKGNHFTIEPISVHSRTPEGYNPTCNSDLNDDVQEQDSDHF